MRIPVLLSVAGLSMAPAPTTPPELGYVKQFQCARRLLARGEYLKAADLLAPYGTRQQIADQVIAFVTGHAGKACGRRGDGRSGRPSEALPRKASRCHPGNCEARASNEHRDLE
jgi:hypothetical protein